MYLISEMATLKHYLNQMKMNFEEIFNFHSSYWIYTGMTLFNRRCKIIVNKNEYKMERGCDQSFYDRTY